ncbi:MAG: HlyD family secretion protein [Massilia sp.]
MRPSPHLLCLLLAAPLAACGDQRADFYPGYAQADYVRLASPLAGKLARLYVQRGDQLAPGAPAFVLEQDNERAARAASQHRLERARALLADLEKGRRPDELAAARAQLAQAEAAQKLSQADLERATALRQAQFVAQARVDEARAALLRDQGRVRELQAQLRVARLAARPDQLAAARQDIRTAEAELAQADWLLAQKSLKAPLAASVADVLYREGELVPAGMPVVSLLAPEYLRARFFVPQPELGRIRLGQRVTLACDGCGAPLPATVSFIAPEAEYTAPLIYSRENRATLVFMLEARPAPGGAARLHPGQPLEVRLAGAR